MEFKPTRVIYPSKSTGLTFPTDGVEPVFAFSTVNSHRSDTQPLSDIPEPDLSLVLEYVAPLIGHDFTICINANFICEETYDSDALADLLRQAESSGEAGNYNFTQASLIANVNILKLYETVKTHFNGLGYSARMVLDSTESILPYITLRSANDSKLTNTQLIQLDKQFKQFWLAEHPL